MARTPGPAVLYLRMSPEVRESLRAAAKDAGCSLNAYAVQILATTAGDPARFRGAESRATAARQIERDALGFPLDRKAKWEHTTARGEFVAVMDGERPLEEVSALVKDLDAHNPGYFVEWVRLRRAEEAATASVEREAARRSSAGGLTA